MAVMYFSKDGPRPDSQRGPGIDLTLEEIETVFPGDPLRYVGIDPPSFNVARPSFSVRNVVLHIDEDDGFSSRLPQAGFYWLIGLRPLVAEDRLREHRSRRQRR
jgi:hypothetical protein